MIEADLLLTDTKKLVVSLVDDLRSVVAADADAASYVDTEYQRAHAAGRTAFSKSEWADGLYAQVAVAWVLGVVFVRFCEDNDLIDDPLLGGPGIRSQLALDHRAEYLREHPSHDDRHWLREVFGRVRSLPATGEIFGAHNPVWADSLLPSADGARRVREELSRLDPDSGAIRHDFSDSTWDTRFLGDLYQDLSEHAKKTYALLQTPEFVEEFILGRTLDPAIATFGLPDTTIIDPTCGSGHFLLGAFRRLFDRWVEESPSTPRRELAQRALDAIGGIDLNPFAASIARFRLLVAALRAGGDARLADSPAYPIHVAVGDSLLHGDPPGSLPATSTGDDQLASRHGYSMEDVQQARALLSRQWCAVVGNPPYKRQPDPALRALYKARFASCGGKFTLSVPFTELFWHLGRQSTSSDDRVGFVGLINANAFMKAAFGRKLVTSWFPMHDVTHIIDTSGAYIPGHGTPTAIMFGRARRPLEPTVRVLMSLRGEQGTPADPATGKVWSELQIALDSPSFNGRFLSSTDMPRSRLFTHPWSIGGGGAAELKDRLDEACPRRLGDFIDVGISAVLGEEEPFVRRTAAEWSRAGVSDSETRLLLRGEDVRDWRLSQSTPVALFPYSGSGELRSLSVAAEHAMWPFRSSLEGYKFYGETRRQRGLRWYQYGALMREKLDAETGLALAYKVTHNHAAVIGSDVLAKQTAPVLTTLPRHREMLHPLLALINSSTALFWLKQVCRNVGDSTDRSGARVSGVEGWIDTFQYDGSSIAALPVPLELSAETAATLDSLAQQLADGTPSAIAGAGAPSPQRLADAAERYEDLRARMVAAQERLDWEVYRLYGLIDDDLTSGDEPEPPLELGERAFELVLARRAAAGEEETTWFSRHGSKPIVELPSRWSPAYRALVERRMEVIESDLNIGLIERPEHKRRWATKPWHEQLSVALRDWLLNRLEDPRYWPEPAAITTVARLTTAARADDDFVQVARQYAGRDDVDLAALIADLLKGESVAYLAAHRYTDAGLRKHADWLKTWELQRREDAGEDVGTIPVPPKYAKADFLGAGWEHRGKLDVPKERFISYPGAERETDASMVIGWAGWNHLDRARALAAWYLQARRDGRDTTHLTPLLAGLAELVPWLKQWHDEPNADPALDRPGTQIAALVETELRSLGLTGDALIGWRPEKKRAGRRRRAST